MTARSVIISMPFGGKSLEGRRKAILNYKRLEYLVKKCKVKSVESKVLVSVDLEDKPLKSIENCYVAYAVDVGKTAINPIDSKVMADIKRADIVIGLVEQPNANVTCEIRARREMDLPTILVGDWPETPVYENHFPRLSWKQPSIEAQIDLLVSDHNIKLGDFFVGIPYALKNVIDANDDELLANLQYALQEKEDNFQPPGMVYHLRKIVSPDIINFYPCSIVKFVFLGNNEIDPQNPPEVIDFDERFSHLYGCANKQQALNAKPWTAEKLFAKLQDFVDSADLNSFMQDQARLTNEISKGSYAVAEIPLRFNELHSDLNYRGKSYMPCVVAQVVEPNVNNVEGSHTLYMLVEYIKIPDNLVARLLS
jgi:hypothetical protein